MGRPKADIDWGKVDRFLQSHCDGVGIAGLLGIHPNTLYQACEEKHKCNFSVYSAQKKSEGKDLLKAKMFETAMSGDKTIQIWLSKQYLGMKDKQEVEHTGDTPINLNIIVDSSDTAETLKRLRNADSKAD